MAPETHEPHAHHKTGHRYIDLIVAVSAIFISVVSLIVAVHHGKIMERLVASNSIPHLTLESGNALPESNGQFRRASYVNLRNVGVGPAQVKSLRVYYKGRLLRSTVDMFKLCCGRDTSSGEPNLVLNQQRDRFIPAGERSLLFEYPQTTSNQKDWQKLERVRYELIYDVCYCSVFDECYRLRTGPDGLHTKVDECRPDEREQFVP